jgi:hypothetical protein
MSRGNPPTAITGRVPSGRRSACPQEGAGNLSERFLAKEQKTKEQENRFERIAIRPNKRGHYERLGCWR